MKSTAARLFSLLVISSPSVLSAQMRPGPGDPPPVLMIQREVVKAGMGPAHERSESAWAAAFARAKRPTNWIGMNAMTGPNEVWFLSGYPSFAAMEKDNAEVAANATLTGESNRQAVTDAGYTSDNSTMMAVNMPSLQSGPAVDLSQVRFFNVITVHVRPGHDEDFVKIASMIKDGYTKAKINESWAVFRVTAGDRDGTYLVISPMHSLANLDQGNAEDAMMSKAVGSDGMAALAKASADGIISSSSQLMQVNPKMSYVSSEFKAGDRSFWK